MFFSQSTKRLSPTEFTQISEVKEEVNQPSVVFDSYPDSDTDSVHSDEKIEQENLLPKTQEFKKEGELNGRKASCCRGSSTRALLIIATVVGSVLLVLGLIALAGYFAPQGGAGGFAEFLHKVNTVTTNIATSMGSDPFLLVMFTTAFGVGFTTLGTGGLISLKCRKPQEPDQTAGTVV